YRRRKTSAWAAAETSQRCRPAGGRIRSSRQTHAGQLSAGIFPCRAGEFGAQFPACHGTEGNGGSDQAKKSPADRQDGLMSAVLPDAKLPEGFPPVDFERDALFLDIDGTMIDIATTPESVVVPESLKLSLTRVREHLGGALAVVSGRTL